MTHPSLPFSWATLIAGLGLTCAANGTFSADAQLVLTYTLDDVVLNGSSSAVFETSSTVGDLQFVDIGPNGFSLAQGSFDAERRLG